MMRVRRGASPSIGRRVFVRLGACGAASAALPACLLGCGSAALVPVEARRVASRTIDADRFALLPPRILVLADLDLVALFATPIGADVAALVQTLVPLGPESNFVPARDTTRASAGLYAMQGLDFCAVVQGRFDVAAIQRAADARLAVAAGVPLVRTRYGVHQLYTAGNVGFALLSSGTMLSGNETGMRRVLDRLRFGRLERAIPAWMIALAETAGTGFTLAGDFGARSVMMASRRPGSAVPRPGSSPAIPVLEAAASKLPFLSGLRALRVLGNFQAPGLNFAGALTYASADKAARGAEGLRSASQLAQWANMFSSGAGIPPIKVAVNGTDVGFVQPIESGAARSLIGLIRSMT